MSLGKDRIAALIPHAGAMCLLDEIVSWDTNSIHARSTTHRAPDNPLRIDERLPVWSGIEYAAQAMAAHGALFGIVSSRPRTGYLVSLRNVRAHAPYLDDVAGELTVEARHIDSNAALAVYSFEVRVGEREVLSGTATVVLQVEAS